MNEQLLEVDGGAAVAAGIDVWTRVNPTLYELPLVDASRLKQELDRNEFSLWRYRAVLPFETSSTLWRTLTLGEGATPLISAGTSYPGLRLKVEYASPTQSFKDRGAAVMVAKAAEWSVRHVVADSSGNAGTALAAYAARAGMACDVFVPASASPAKLVQIEQHGATVHRIEGPRARATQAAQAYVAERQIFYASHIYNPYFYEGTKTFAYEIWEQSGFVAPECVYLPVGHGTLVLGVSKGFRELLQAGLIGRMPTIYAAQAAACAPIATAFGAGARQVEPLEGGNTLAEGVAIVSPPRGSLILDAVRATGGEVVAIGDDEISEARVELARMGLFVEPTAALPFAAWRRARHDGAVVPLCGSGLKAPYA